MQAVAQRGSGTKGVVEDNDIYGGNTHAGVAIQDGANRNVLRWWRDDARGVGGRFDLHGMTKAQFKYWTTDLAWCLRQLDGETARVRLTVVTGQGRLSGWLRSDATLWESDVLIK